MSRRGVLTGLVALGAVAAGGQMLSISRDSRRYAERAAALRVPFDPSHEMPSLVRFATLAANAHNTQPWRFSVSEGKGGPTGITIAPDLSRHTPVVDPDDHHLHVSLGCAAENLALAAEAGAEREVEVAYAGEAEGVGITLGRAGSAVASETTQALFHSIPKRQSTRSVFDGRPVEASDVGRLRDAADAVAGVDTVIVTDRRQMTQVRDLVISANTRQMSDPAFMSELEEWIRFSPGQALEREDGLYAPASGNPALPAWLGELLFARVVKARSENARYSAQIDGSSGLAVFFADQSSPDGWIAVGRACQRFCLMATALGMKTAFVNQPVEVEAFRADLSALAGMKGRRPDLLLRFGYAPSLPYSLRRPAEKVMA
ncbi:MAG: Tat pathway signal protein [Rhizobiales bacterium]|nr:Tat pathway signal protein [Hyphomicrobiales bacterium]MBA68693.1 Tat pathway signal protein [Hyphomicrobiales bacterium]